MAEYHDAEAVLAQLRPFYERREGVSLAANSNWRQVTTRLEIYAELLVKWNARINLVAPSTIPQLWRRHILDSGQLLHWIGPAVVRLADIGSGAGLPGLILACLGVKEVHLIESDSRKCAFLREAARLMDLPIAIHNCRIETMEPLGADLVTARALAPLDKLFPLADRHRHREGHLLFLKGRNWGQEIDERLLGQGAFREYPSLTADDAVVLELGAVPWQQDNIPERR